MPRGLRWSILILGAVVVAAPLLQLVMESTQVNSEIWQHLKKNQLPDSISETLFFSFFSALIALIIGLCWSVLGLLLPRLQILFKISMALLLAIPTYVIGFLMLSFIDFSGPVQMLLKNLWGPDYFFEPRSRLWAVLIYGMSTAPYVYFSVETALKSQVKKFLEASISLGAGTGKTIFRVMLPSVFPWSLGGAALVALEAVSDFGFVDLFGLNTLSRLLYKSWGSLFSFGGAARVSLVLIGICLLIMFFIRLLRRTDLQRDLSEKQDYQNLFRLNTATQIGLLLPALSGLFIMSIIPIGALLYHASDLKLWTELPLSSALLSSLSVSVLSGVFVLALATMIFFATQKSFTTLRFLDFFNLGYGLPGTLLAVAFYIFFSRFLNIKVLSDQNLILFLIISLLYFVKFSGLALRGLDSQQKQIDPKILESASLLADSQKVFWKIELKLYKPALGLGLFLLILEIIKELPAALMIKPLQSPTLAVRIHQYASESDWARASVYSLLLLFLVGLLLVLKRLAETETK